MVSSRSSQPSDTAETVGSGGGECDLVLSDSGVSSLFGTEDSRSTSSGDISGSSSFGSGDIPATMLEQPLVTEELQKNVESNTGTTDVGVTTAEANETVATAEANITGATAEVNEPVMTAPAREACVGRRNKSVSWGFASVIGRRAEMEDAVAIIPGFMTSKCDHVGGCSAPGSRTASEVTPIHFFGVYDGHGGSQVAKFCAERMHDVVAEEWKKREVDANGWRRRWEETFSSSFTRTDNLISEESVAPEIVGSTAVVVALSGCQIITSNCGDSRAILCRGTGTIQLSIDHKPDREDELVRIEEAGGRVFSWYGNRVFGVLAMSRSIGDRYMRPWVIPDPEITFTARSEEDECLIVASDGLWDVMSNDEVGEIARHLFRRLRRASMADETSPLPAQAVADQLTEIAYRKNSSDNISIVVVDLKLRRKRQPRQAK